MADTVTPSLRSRMMAGIRGKNTRPELALRRALHARGFRYRLHAKGLPGRPDLVFPGRHAVVFVHGCFWHGHGCAVFRWPKSRTDWWKSKIEGNQQRDTANQHKLAESGWRVAVVWECAIRSAATLMDAPSVLAEWLVSDIDSLVIVRP